MDLERLHELLRATTRQYRKGPRESAKYVNGLLTHEIFDMPPVDEIPQDHAQVDVHFVIIGVDKAAAEARREELVEILRTYPNRDRLAAGPSYIEVGAEIGDQGAAFCLFALGKVLDIWGVITPETLGARGDDAAQLAGNGYVMIGPKEGLADMLGLI